MSAFNVPLWRYEDFAMVMCQAKFATDAGVMLLGDLWLRHSVQEYGILDHSIQHSTLFNIAESP
jgi:hypothetical protein